MKHLSVNAKIKSLGENRIAVEEIEFPQFAFIKPTPEKSYEEIIEKLESKGVFVGDLTKKFLQEGWCLEHGCQTVFVPKDFLTTYRSYYRAGKVVKKPTRLRNTEMPNFMTLWGLKPVPKAVLPQLWLQCDKYDLLAQYEVRTFVVTNSKMQDEKHQRLLAGINNTKNKKGFFAYPEDEDLILNAETELIDGYICQKADESRYDEELRAKLSQWIAL